MTDQFRKYFAEFVGAAILVFGGSLAIVSVGGRGDAGGVAVIALGFGLSLLMALYALGEISGGHFNPAVTLAAFLDGRINLTDGINYWIAQIAGGVVASLGVYWASNREAVASTATNPAPAVGDGSAFLIELVLTAVFVMVALKVTRSPDLKSGAFLAMPLALVGIYAAAFPLTGASVNPARSIGPAIVGDSAGNLWIYLVATLAGAIVGWIVYQISTRETVAVDVHTE